MEKFPWADTSEYAAPLQAQVIVFAGRPGQAGRFTEILTRLHGVVTAEVHGFANLGQGIRQRASGLCAEQPDQRGMAVPQKRSAAPIEDVGTFAASRTVSSRLARPAQRQALRRLCCAEASATAPTPICWSEGLTTGIASPLCNSPSMIGPRLVEPLGRGAGRGSQRAETERIVPGRGRGNWYGLRPSVGKGAAAGGMLACRRQSPATMVPVVILYHLAYRRLGIEEAVDEGTVGAVLQQSGEPDKGADRDAKPTGA